MVVVCLHFRFDYIGGSEADVNTQLPGCHQCSMVQLFVSPKYYHLSGGSTDFY